MMATRQSSSTSLNKLKEEITCPVCLEIFSDPQALSCLHTLCLQCAHDIAKSSKKPIVPCPTCRTVTSITNLRKDFKTANFIESYQHLASERVQSSQSRPLPPRPSEVPSRRNCKLCEEKTAIYKCRKCAVLTCNTCMKAHVKMADCWESDSITLESLVATTAEELRQWRTVLQERGKSEDTSYSNDIKKMEEQQYEALKSIDKQEQDALEHFRNERQKVSGGFDKAKEVRKIGHARYQQQIKDKIYKITKLEKANEEHMFEESETDDLKKDLEQLQSASFNAIETSITNRDFDKNHAISIALNTVQERLQYDDISVPTEQAPGPKPLPALAPKPSAKAPPALPPLPPACPVMPSHHSNPALPPPNQPPPLRPRSQPRTSWPAGATAPPIHLMRTVSSNFITSSPKTISKAVPLAGTVGKMLLFNSKLLYLTWDSIEIYNPATAQNIKPLASGFTGARSMAIMGNIKLLIATDSGLLEYTTEGSKVDWINNKPHYDITASHGWAVALRAENSHIHIDQYNNQLNRIHHTATQVRDDENPMTCTVTGGYVYICSAGQNCIYKIDKLSGDIRQTIGGLGQSPGQFSLPYLCCVDGHVFVIADHNNHRLQLFDSQANAWDVVRIQGSVKYPTAAVFDSEGKLFVAGREPCTLYTIN